MDAIASLWMQLWSDTQTLHQALTILIFLVTIIFFLIGKIRSDIVALGCMAALMLCGIVTPKAALSGFANTAVIIMVFLFVVGGAIFQTGLAKYIAGRFLRLAGTNEKNLFFVVMSVTAVVAAFVSNTGTVAMLLPIVLAMAKTAGVNPSRLMMPLAFASSMGGVLTLIGTPPNLIVDGYLRDNGRPGFGFFEFTPIGLVLLLVGLICLYPLCKLLLSSKGKSEDDANDDKSLNELLHEYSIDNKIYRLQIKGESHLVGHSVGELEIHQRYDVRLLEIRRARRSAFFNAHLQEGVLPDTIFRLGDTLYAVGKPESIEAFAKHCALTICHDKATEENSQLDFYELGMAEMLLLPESHFIGQTLRGMNFRKNFGVNVVAIKRGDEYEYDEIQDVTLKTGDMLLVHGDWHGIEGLSRKRREWVTIGRPQDIAENEPLTHKAPLASIIMILMIIAMVFADQIGVAPVTSVITAGVLIVLTRCIRSADAAYRAIGWESIVLIAAMMSMSVALSETGLSKIIADSIVSGLQSFGPYGVLAGVYLVTSLLSTFLSNSATAILVAPIAWEAAAKLSVDPHAFMMTAAVAASAVFATPICTPPNAMVMTAGRYTFADYMRVGVPLQVIMMIVSLLVIPFFFPL